MSNSYRPFRVISDCVAGKLPYDVYERQKRMGLSSTVAWAEISAVIARW